MTTDAPPRPALALGLLCAVLAAACGVGGAATAHGALLGAAVALLAGPLAHASLARARGRPVGGLGALLGAGFRVAGLGPLAALALSTLAAWVAWLTPGALPAAAVGAALGGLAARALRRREDFAGLTTMFVVSHMCALVAAAELGDRLLTTGALEGVGRPGLVPLALAGGGALASAVATLAALVDRDDEGALGRAAARAALLAATGVLVAALLLGDAVAHVSVAGRPERGLQLAVSVGLLLGTLLVLATPWALAPERRRGEGALRVGLALRPASAQVVLVLGVVYVAWTAAGPWGVALAAVGFVATLAIPLGIVATGALAPEGPAAAARSLGPRVGLVAGGLTALALALLPAMQHQCPAQPLVPLALAALATLAARLLGATALLAFLLAGALALAHAAPAAPAPGAAPPAAPGPGPDLRVAPERDE